MATKTEKEDTRVLVSNKDLDRFHRNAPAALERRGGASAREEVLGGLQTMFFGGLPIVGLICWGWSGADLIVFLLAGAWVGIFCDAAKVLLLRKRAEAFAAAAYDDWHVWVVVGALRDGSKKAEPSHLQAKWDPMGGIFVDLAMGGVSTLLIVVMLVSQAGLGLDVLTKPTVAIGLVVMALLRVGGTIAEVVHHRVSDHHRAERQGEWTGADADRPVKAMVGLRGVGLFLMVFLVAVLTDEEKGMNVDATWWAMLVVNSLVLLVGLLNATGPLWLHGETAWLRDYLAKRERGATA